MKSPSILDRRAFLLGGKAFTGIMSGSEQPEYPAGAFNDSYRLFNECIND